MPWLLVCCASTAAELRSAWRDEFELTILILLPDVLLVVQSSYADYSIILYVVRRVRSKTRKNFFRSENKFVRADFIIFTLPLAPPVSTPSSVYS